MLTNLVTVRPSYQIRLHKAILDRNEVLSLELIDRISNATQQTNPARLVYINPNVGHIALCAAVPTQQFILRQIQTAACPNIFEINGSLQSSLQLAAANGLLNVVSRL